MRRKQWTQEEIDEILKAADAPGASIGEVCRLFGVSRFNVARWRRRRENPQQWHARGLAALEKENAQLKQLLATRDLELDVLKRLLQKNSLRHSNGGKL